MERRRARAFCCSTSRPSASMSGAREEIYGLVRDGGASGTGVLVVSSDLAELLLLCDRISIVVDGRDRSRRSARDESASAEELHHLIQTLQPARGRRHDAIATFHPQRPQAAGANATPRASRRCCCRATGPT